MPKKAKKPLGPKKPQRHELLKKPLRELKRRLQVIKAESRRPSPKSSSGLLSTWEISGRNDLKNVRRDLYLRLLLFAGLGLLLVVILMNSFGPMKKSYALFLLPPGLGAVIGCLTTLWRLRLLKSLEFISFRGWLLGLIKLLNPFSKRD
jgi:hypothetical protein